MEFWSIRRETRLWRGIENPCSTNQAFSNANFRHAWWKADWQGHRRNCFLLIETRLHDHKRGGIEQGGRQGFPVSETGNSLRTFDLLYFLKNFVSDQLFFRPCGWKHLKDRNDVKKNKNIYIYIKDCRRRTSSEFSRSGSLYYLLATRMFQKFRH